MKICQWEPLRWKCGTLCYCSCTVVFCIPTIWYSCGRLILETIFAQFRTWCWMVICCLVSNHYFKQLMGWVQSCRFSWCIFTSGLHLWHSTTFDGVTKWRVAEGQQEANANRWLGDETVTTEIFRATWAFKSCWHDIPEWLQVWAILSTQPCVLILRVPGRYISREFVRLWQNTCHVSVCNCTR